MSPIVPYYMKTDADATSPGARSRITGIVYLKILGFIAAASLMLWIIVKGIDVQRWSELATARRGSLA
jgi:hypothetical protein